ncbi:MAG TPA: MBOAT family protein [Bryobacteraceae bacterium]|nr:MBOAT family protein [Bryobacteraceae bacterium]
MVLSSSAYFIFLVGVFFLYWPVARFRALSLAVVLFANYFFYAKWDLFYLALIPAASTCDYLIALGLQRSRTNWLRRALVTLSVLLNLGILASFKYMPFFLENYARFSGRQAPEWHWIFPLGISFYAFQSLTYTIDVYRRDARAASSYLAYLASVSFFPTTLAGPITRVATLLPQFEKKDKALSSADAGRAIFLIALGLTKKLLIADYLADNLVNRVFDLPKLYTAAETLVAVYAYALQLYYDFSGYTDIAIGSALLLAIKLPPNFNMPYAAENIADFWRRWHISLSNWLRDYLYFALPGLRSKWKIFTYSNLILTMLLGGLWHGASWNFVIWGLLHGVALAVTRAWQTFTGSKARGGWRKIARVFATVHFVCFAWIFFRSSTLESALAILGRIASLTVSFDNISAPVALVLVIAVLAHYFPLTWQGWVIDRFAATPFYAQAAALMLLAVALQYVAASGVAPFIYTKF